jgi:hypothetical protein
MKTSKILSFLLIGIIGTQTTLASDALKLGVRAGLNLGKMETGGNYSYSYEDPSGNFKQSNKRTSDASQMTGNLIGFQVGTVLDIKITDFFYVQPGIMLSSKGGETESTRESSSTGMGNTSSSEDNMKYNPYYIDVPIMLSLKGTLADNLSLRAQVGPYFGFGLFGGAEYSYKDSRYPEENEKTKVKNVFSPTEEEKENFEFNGFNRFNFGIGFGGGIEFNDFYLGVSYNMGLTNLHNNPKEYEQELYEHTVSFTLGYNF